MVNPPDSSSIWSTLLLLPPLFVAFSVHGFAHSLVAFLLGDTSQVESKRLSFNPLRHMSRLGAASVDPARLQIKNRAFGMLLVSVAGPMANLLMALAALLGMTATVTVVWTLTGASPVEVLGLMMAQQPGPDAQGLVVAFTYYMIEVNLMLAFFSMLPLPPLDGFQVLMSLYGLARGGVMRGMDGAAVSQPAGEPVAGEEPAPSPAQIHFDIGVEYHKADQIDEAIARYRQALAHDQGFALAYYNQGLAYWTKGRLPLATSAFKAAMRSSHHLGVRIQADLRLSELAQAERDPEVELGPAPQPLEPGGTVEAAPEVAAPLAPAVARRVWLRLAIGAMVMLILAIVTWLFVTAVTLASVA